MKTTCAFPSGNILWVPVSPSLTVFENNITDRKVFSFHSMKLLSFYFVLLLFLRWEDSSALYYGIQAICTYIYPEFKPRAAGTLSKQIPCPQLTEFVEDSNC
jgi:hypothetical protein